MGIALCSNCMVLMLKYLNETTFYYLSAPDAETAKVNKLLHHVTSVVTLCNVD
jgi:hypothetical protein